MSKNSSNNPPADLPTEWKRIVLEEDSDGNVRPVAIEDIISKKRAGIEDRAAQTTQRGREVERPTGGEKRPLSAEELLKKFSQTKNAKSPPVSNASEFGSRQANFSGEARPFEVGRRPEEFQQFDENIAELIESSDSLSEMDSAYERTVANISLADLMNQNRGGGDFPLYSRGDGSGESPELKTDSGIEGEYRDLTGGPSVAENYSPDEVADYSPDEMAGGQLGKELAGEIPNSPEPPGSDGERGSPSVEDTLSQGGDLPFEDAKTPIPIRLLPSEGEDGGTPELRGEPYHKEQPGYSHPSKKEISPRLPPLFRKSQSEGGELGKSPADELVKRNRSTWHVESSAEEEDILSLEDQVEEASDSGDWEATKIAPVAFISFQDGGEPPAAKGDGEGESVERKSFEDLDTSESLREFPSDTGEFRKGVDSAAPSTDSELSVRISSKVEEIEAESSGELELSSEREGESSGIGDSGEFSFESVKVDSDGEGELGEPVELEGGEEELSERLSEGVGVDIQWEKPVLTPPQKLKTLGISREEKFPKPGDGEEEGLVARGKLSEDSELSTGKVSRKGGGRSDLGASEFSAGGVSRDRVGESAREAGEGNKGEVLQGLLDSIVRQNEKLEEHIEELNQLLYGIQAPLTSQILYPLFRDLVVLYDYLSGKIEDVEDRSALSHLIDVREYVLELMRRHGLTLVEIESTQFDSKTQRALKFIPTDDAREDGEIVRVLRAGFWLGEQLFRPVEVEIKRYKK